MADLAVLAAAVGGLLLAALIGHELLVRIKPDASQAIAAWVQAIGLPFAIFFTYYAAQSQVTAQQRYSQLTARTHMAIELAYVHELSRWIAFSLSEDLRADEEGSKLHLVEAHTSMALENLRTFRGLDLARFSASGMASLMLGTRVWLTYVVPFYEKPGSSKLVRRHFETALKEIADLAVGIELVLERLRKEGLLQPVPYVPVKLWAFTPDWHAYLSSPSGPPAQGVQ